MTQYKQSDEIKDKHHHKYDNAELQHNQPVHHQNTFYQEALAGTKTGPRGVNHCIGASLSFGQHVLVMPHSMPWLTEVLLLVRYHYANEPPLTPRRQTPTTKAPGQTHHLQFPRTPIRKN